MCLTRQALASFQAGGHGMERDLPSYSQASQGGSLWDLRNPKLPPLDDFLSHDSDQRIGRKRSEEKPIASAVRGISI